ncbi:TcpE family conjugal transfer membrane protein [Culicoidibacter larvae]|uniref:Conjugal transfer protein n=1 Tax=Culicoidibacter larvae TaxID=2579976 RepID=A0A5R8Q847_9FIRM|nr:TcpE family conjugal transfer membrane protein [Culicoidibacter larvae]TLG71275.1 hypothetical protein FEZ08_11030 [Culicoidibacter larvae]
MRIVRVYDSVWKVKIMVYAIGNITLDRPIPLLGLLIFIVTLGIESFLFFQLGLLSQLLNMPLLVLIYILIPVGAYMYLPNANIDGKHIFFFLKDYIRFMIRPKVTDANKRIVDGPVHMDNAAETIIWKEE